MRAQPFVRIGALVCALALVAAACGGSSEDPASTGTDNAAEAAGSTDEPSSDAADDESTATSDAGDADTTPAEPIELTDSYRGVTAETISLGYTSIDFDLLNSSFSLNLPEQSYAPMADAIVGMYNERGGVLGRSIELVHASYLPAGPTSADEACVQLADDEEVFAVLGGFAGPGAVEVNSCFTEIYDMILVGPAPREEQAAASAGLWVSASMESNRRNAAVARLLAETGVADGLGPTMVIGSAPDELVLVDALADGLVAEGVDVVIREVVTTQGDQIATANDVDLWIERARTSDVTSVVLLGEDIFRNEAFFANAPEFTYIMGTGDSLSSWQSTPPNGLQSGTRVLTNTSGSDDAAFDDPAMQECRDAVEAALGVEVLPPSELPEGDPNYFAGTTSACRTIALFVQIAETAGADLTNDSWLAALDQLPDLSLPGYAFSSISSEKFDANDQLLLVEYDLDTLSFDPLTDAVDVG